MGSLNTECRGFLSAKDKAYSLRNSVDSLQAYDGVTPVVIGPRIMNRIMIRLALCVRAANAAPHPRGAGPAPGGRATQ